MIRREDQHMADESGFCQEYLLMIRKRRQYYLDIFRKMQEKKSVFSFNAAALLFGPFWLIYRKMYLTGLLLLLLYAAPLYIHALLFPVLALLWSIMLGFLGNDFYWLKIRRVIRKFESAEPAWKKGYMEIIGGTSVFPVIVALLLCLFSVLTLAARGIYPVAPYDFFWTGR